MTLSDAPRNVTVLVVPHHGPIINFDPAHQTAISMRWTGHEVTADLEGLQREIMKRSQALQYELFKELDQARKERQMMNDAVARLLRMTDNLDGAMTAALGSTFDYFRAGGR